MNLQDKSLFRQQCYIDGAWADADGGATIDVTNPATDEIIGTVPRMGAGETRRAIEAANAAFPAWRSLTAKARAVTLRKFFDLMMANQEDLAQLMTAEQGKPLAESRGEIAYAASFIEWFAEEGKRAYGDVIPPTFSDRRIVVIKQPVGVVASITPWNFPAAMITRKVGPALAAGCTVVAKPATATPYSALALAELAERAGIPSGVMNIITGSAGAIGGELTANPIVRLHRNRQDAHEAMRRHREEGLHGTRRPRPLHRLRRRPDRRRGGRRHGVQVPQHGPDLCLRQPLPGAGRRL